MRMRALLEEGKKLDVALLTFHLKSANLTFKDNLPVDGFLEGLAMLSHGMGEDVFKNAADTIKLLTVRRDLEAVGEGIKKTARSSPSSLSYDEILEECDQIYNQKVELYESTSRGTINLMDAMEDMVMERTMDRSIFKEQGPMGPHKTLNNLCGSLTKMGNITILCAGSGVGKTQFTAHYCTFIAGKHGVPVLHLDNGEMSEFDIVSRMCASIMLKVEIGGTAQTQRKL